MIIFVEPESDPIVRSDLLQYVLSVFQACLCCWKLLYHLEKQDINIAEVCLLKLWFANFMSLPWDLLYSCSLIQQHEQQILFHILRWKFLEFLGALGVLRILKLQRSSSIQLHLAPLGSPCVTTLTLYAQDLKKLWKYDSRISCFTNVIWYILI